MDIQEHRRYVDAQGTRWSLYVLETISECWYEFVLNDLDGHFCIAVGAEQLLNMKILKYYLENCRPEFFRWLEKSKIQFGSYISDRKPIRNLNFKTGIDIRNIGIMFLEDSEDEMIFKLCFELHLVEDMGILL